MESWPGTRFPCDLRALAATRFCFMSFCIRHLKVDNLFRQLKMELCEAEDYEIAG